MPTFHLEIVNESAYDFTLSAEHLASASWAPNPSSPKASTSNKTAALPAKQTTSMSFVASFAQLSGALTYVSTGREIPMFIQIAFSSPIVGPPLFNARVSARAQVLHDYVSTASSAAPVGISALVESENCFWTLRNDAAKKSVVHVMNVQFDDSLAAGAGTTAPVAPAISSSCFFVLKVRNDSAIEFRYDGDFVTPSPPVPLSRTRVPARTAGINGDHDKWAASESEIAVPLNVCGCWWYRGSDVDGKSYFLSLAVYTNSLGKTFFWVSCGAPPFDLQKEYASITSNTLHLVSKSKLNAPPVPCAGCEWVATQRGSGKNTVVEMKIDQNLKCYNVLDYPVASGSIISSFEDEPVPASSSASNPIVSAVADQEIINSASLASSASSAVSATSTPPPDPQNADASDKLDNEKAGNLMNSSRPKNFFGGLTSAVKCVGAGFVAGGVALVAAPVVGFKEKGWRGGVAGFFQGVVGGAALAAAGVVAGGAQVVRGAWNTPEALRQGLINRNMKWDSELGAWVENTVVLRDMVALAEEEAKEDEASERAQSGFVAGRSVKETRFYDILGITPDTPPEGLKKAYYKAAVRCHPDKNPGDPEAHAKFQELSKAYSVLSDDAARARYDELGESGVSEQAEPQFDAMLFFSVLFGSEKFEPYVGDLAIATTAAKMFSNAEKHVAKGGMSAESAKEEMMQHSDMAEKEKRQQWRRTVRIADHLASRLATFVQEGLQDEFVTAAYVESHELVRQSFGPQLLSSLGWVYAYRARKFFSSQGISYGDGGAFEVMASLKKSRRTAGQKLEVGTNIFKSVRAVQSIAAATQKEQIADHTIRVGCYVKVVGLKNRPELNGAEGRVYQLEDASAVVALQGSQGEKQLKMKLENLEFVKASPDSRGDDPTKGLLAANMPLLLNTAWSLSAMDIEASASRAAKYVTRDVGVPWQTRFNRARALLLLGKIFMEVGAAHSSSMSDADAGLDADSAMRKVEQALASSVKEKK